MIGLPYKEEIISNFGLPYKALISNFMTSNKKCSKKIFRKQLRQPKLDQLTHNSCDDPIIKAIERGLVELKCMML